MSIDFTVVLNDQDESPLQDTLAMQANGGVKINLTLGRAVSHALMVQGNDEQEMTGEQKFHRGMLAFKVRDSKDCELKVEDIVLIKKQLARLYSPVVIYRAYLLLDGGEKP